MIKEEMSMSKSPLGSEGECEPRNKFRLSLLGKQVLMSVVSASAERLFIKIIREHPSPIRPWLQALARSFHVVCATNFWFERLVDVPCTRQYFCSWDQSKHVLSFGLGALQGEDNRRCQTTVLPGVFVPAYAPSQRYATPPSTQDSGHQRRRTSREKA